jgi:hypothetical protein
MTTKIPDELFQTAKAPTPAVKRPTRCRVKLPDKMSLPIIGGGSTAFDAEFDWDRMVAVGTVEGRQVMVGIQMCAITFYKDGETR